MLPVGPCDFWYLQATYPDLSGAYDGQSCHQLCEHFDLLTDSNGTWPERELECSYKATATSQTSICEDATFLVFSKCQQRLSEYGPYNRTQCVCGSSEDEDKTQPVVVCDSDYYKSREGARPPLECASLNITDRNSCIDVATRFGQDFYCNKSSTPCTLKYQTTMGNHAMCTSQWRQGCPEVICGDACAWTEEAWSQGHRIAGCIGVSGLALALSVAIVVL